MAEKGAPVCASGRSWYLSRHRTFQNPGAASEKADSGLILGENWRFHCMPSSAASIVLTMCEHYNTFSIKISKTSFNCFRGHAQV